MFPEPKIQPRQCAKTVRRLSAWLTVAMLLTSLVGVASCALYGLDDDGFDVPIIVRHTTKLPIDLDSLPTAGATAPSRLEADLTLPPLPVDLTKSGNDLVDDEGELEELEIKQITVVPVHNTVTAPLPPIDLYVGPEGATKAEEGILVATIPSVPPGSTQPLGATYDEAGMVAAQEHVRSLKFSLISVATLVVEEGQQFPVGETDLEITFAVIATVDAAK